METRNEKPSLACPARRDRRAAVVRGLYAIRLCEAGLCRVEGGRVAVSGYDTVSYFDGDGVPVKGDAAFAVEHDGAVYHFSNAANAARFAANPEAFAPQYGGHCAWAMSRGYLAPGDPLAYAVVDGKLYLNFIPKSSC
jgi:YHS domain-containing protein